MSAQVKYLKNAWYVAALSTEVNETELFNRRILGLSVMIYRTEDGTPVALQDRCPHRFAPLSMGKRSGDTVSCPYHGLVFNENGQCTHNPHGQGHIPGGAVVRTFPLEERYGFIWIWMGDLPEDYSLFPDYSELDNGPDTAVGHTYMHMNVNYELIIDNVMDLSHIDHLHSEIITTRGKLSPIVPDIKETPITINARWEWAQQPAMMIFADFLPEPKEAADHYFDITWHPPANIQLSVGAEQNGNGSFENDVSQYDLHTVTPEDEFKSHYFFATRRNHHEEDADFNAMKIKAMHDAFENEDGPVVEAVQHEMETSDFFSLNPVLMTNDVSAVKVRRLLLKMIKEEHESTDAAE
ncbi:MAG: Rieske (2Fe-2S) protein [Kordiimonas sp.]|nr:Rieske (2Fe-2S) protein [Kordiimonas sp.]|tara:strand:- start:130 stop:1188 length:1059 start_codon:yes stop_codon:yes gene_type:complete